MFDYIDVCIDGVVLRPAILINFPLFKLKFLVKDAFTLVRPDKGKDPYQEEDDRDDIDYHLTDEGLWIRDWQEDDYYGRLIPCREVTHPIVVAHDFHRARRKADGLIAPDYLAIASDYTRYRAWRFDPSPNGYMAWRRAYARAAESPESFLEWVKGGMKVPDREVAGLEEGRTSAGPPGSQVEGGLLNDPPPPEPAHKPRWDRKGKSLYYGETLLRKYSESALNQISILDAFQAIEWKMVFAKQTSNDWQKSWKPVPVKNPFDNEGVFDQTIKSFNKYMRKNNKSFFLHKENLLVVWSIEPGKPS